MAIASLLLLIAVSLIVLTLVLVTKKRKPRTLRNAAVSNNYETVASSSELLNAETRHHFSDDNANMNSATDRIVMTEVSQAEWNAYPSLPRPPADPGLATLEEWKEEWKEGMEPVANPHYTSTQSIVSSSNMSEPPDYESIQDVQRRQFLYSRGGDHMPPYNPNQRTRSLQDFRQAHGAEPAPLFTGSMDRVRHNVSSKRKMAQLLEVVDETNRGGTTSPLVSHALQAEQFPYSGDDDGRNGDKLEAGDRSSGAMSIDQTVDNDLYEATRGGISNPEYMEIRSSTQQRPPLPLPVVAATPDITSREERETDVEARSDSSLLASSPMYTPMNSVTLLPQQGSGTFPDLEGEGTASVGFCAPEAKKEACRGARLQQSRQDAQDHQHHP